MKNEFLELVYDASFFNAKILRIFKVMNLSFKLQRTFGSNLFDRFEHVTRSVLQDFEDLANGNLKVIDNENRYMRTSLHIEYVNETHSIERCFRLRISHICDTKRPPIYLLNGEYDESEFNRYIFLFIIFRIMNAVCYEDCKIVDYRRLIVDSVIKCISNEFTIIENE